MLQQARARVEPALARAKELAVAKGHELQPALTRAKEAAVPALQQARERVEPVLARAQAMVQPAESLGVIISPPG